MSKNPQKCLILGVWKKIKSLCIIFVDSIEKSTSVQTQMRITRACTLIRHARVSATKIKPRLVCLVTLKETPYMVFNSLTEIFMDFNSNFLTRLSHVYLLAFFWHALLKSSIGLGGLGRQFVGKLRMKLKLFFRVAASEAGCQ